MDLWPFAWKQRPLKLLLMSSLHGDSSQTPPCIQLAQVRSYTTYHPTKSNSKTPRWWVQQKSQQRGQILLTSILSSCFNPFWNLPTSRSGSPGVGKTALGEGIWEVGAVARPGEKNPGSFPNHTESHLKKRKKIMGRSYKVIKFKQPVYVM